MPVKILGDINEWIKIFTNIYYNNECGWLLQKINAEIGRFKD